MTTPTAFSYTDVTDAYGRAYDAYMAAPGYCYIGVVYRQNGSRRWRAAATPGDYATRDRAARAAWEHQAQRAELARI